MANVRGLMKKIKNILNPADENGIRKYTHVRIYNTKLMGLSKKGDRKIKIDKQTYIITDED